MAKSKWIRQRYFNRDTPVAVLLQILPGILYRDTKVPNYEYINATHSVLIKYKAKINSVNAGSFIALSTACNVSNYGKISAYEYNSSI